MKTLVSKSLIASLILCLSPYFFGCKNSKKHKKSKPPTEECDAECEARKERERLKNGKNAQENQLGITMTLDGQAPGATLTMNFTDSAAIVLSGFDAQNMSIGLMKGPNLGMSLIAMTIQSSSLPNGTYPIAILIRDKQKCTAAGGSDCNVQIDAQGRHISSVEVNPAYDAQFTYSIEITGGSSNGGNGGDNGGGSVQPGGNPWNPPGFVNNSNPSFLGKLGDNLFYGVNWIWLWIKGLGGNP